jgi:hypothetical protein
MPLSDLLVCFDRAKAATRKYDVEGMVNAGMARG